MPSQEDETVVIKHTNCVYYSISSFPETVRFSKSRTRAGLVNGCGSVGNGIHDDVDAHLDGLFVVLSTEDSAATVAPAAM